ncbi:hypothetical protein Acr_20g0008100 [Actinidia rufa]|uniref:Uncharacterized protein n=1 Tax=Actinidia rufa TaxID=165716 RepID=A0A7J0GE48_9ERIC|nr:hypothetical protein Acr_20g0008100 [Actinidia rufa]
MRKRDRNWARNWNRKGWGNLLERGVRICCNRGAAAAGSVGPFLVEWAGPLLSSWVCRAFAGGLAGLGWVAVECSSSRCCEAELGWVQELGGWAAELGWGRTGWAGCWAGCRIWAAPLWTDGCEVGLRWRLMVAALAEELGAGQLSWAGEGRAGLGGRIWAAPLWTDGCEVGLRWRLMVAALAEVGICTCRGGRKGLGCTEAAGVWAAVKAMGGG